jgi:TolB-like protein/DNA-binding winged helix-turn-helix (wHTH) protein/Tfp pilus assembly protein PilF
MPEGHPVCGRLCFGVFELDVRAGELRKHGLRLRLQRQPFRVLAVLLEHPGDIVTREELQKKLWPADTFVDFDHGLNKAINKIREALGDSAENPRFVETVTRRGYRFLADVKITDIAQVRSPELATRSHPAVEVRDRPDLASGAKLLKHHLPSAAWKIAVFMLLVLIASLSIRKLYSLNRPPTVIRSLAVLPLENLSGDASQDYFSDGMTDELISDLGQISALRVISRTSVMTYKHARKTLPQIARELSVDAVVEGTVLRSGDHVRITAQLIDASSDKHLWSHSYEGELRDTLGLQNKVARAIAEEIRISLNPQEQAALKKVKIVNPKAYESDLKGRYFWNKRTSDGLKVALAYFNQAIGEDPQYAQAYSGLADTYALLGDWQYGVMTPKEALPKAKAAAIEALELDNSLGEAHTSLAFSLDLFDWDWRAADREFRRAIELNPSYATAHQWYAWHLVILGHDDEAVAELRKAENLDPLSLIIRADTADALLIAGYPDGSIQESQKAIAMDPYFALAHYELGQAFIQKQMYSEAIAELQKAITFSGGSTACTSTLAYAFAVSGRRKEATKTVGDLKNRPNLVSNAPEIALIYVGLDEKDEAISWLEKAYDERFNPSILMRPTFDPIRPDPRFQDLLHRIGLGR